MSDANSNPRLDDIEESLKRLETRLGKVELVLGMPDDEEPDRVEKKAPRKEGDFELAIGQNLFARIGIVVLAIGGMLSMSLPWPSVAPVVPSVVGWLAAILLFLVAHGLQRSMPGNARFFRGAAMALQFFAAFRLCYFVDSADLDPSSGAGATILLVSVAVNIVVALWRRSVFLCALALLTGYVAILAIGTAPVVLVGVTTLLVVAVAASRANHWIWLPVLVIPVNYLTYLIWAIGNPLAGHEVAVVTQPYVAILVLLIWMVFHAVSMAVRTPRSADGVELQVGSFLNVGGYGLFLLHTLTGFSDSFVASNVAASAVLLSIAILFWVRERSHFATFMYAMAGYAALTFALIGMSELPEVFVWLSAQSLLVVATALWFRSRFIIVANFLIYLGVITAYMVLVKSESGISLIFVLVALTSARILKWQMDRLQLKTELMRNAYLTSAFVVFPYALYHIVPPAWVAPSWVGIAVFYYGMTWITHARKYRWMAHNTLLLTLAYILIQGISQTEGTQRVLSFLLLGSVLLVVSLVFTFIHGRRQRNPSSGESDHEDA